MDFRLLNSLAQNKYFVATLIVVVTLIVAGFVTAIMKKIVRKISKSNLKTEQIVGPVKTPLGIFILMVGFFTALNYAYPGLSIKGFGLSQIFLVIWILAGALLVNRIISSIFSWYTRRLQHKLHKKIDKTVLNFIKKVVNLLIYVFALLGMLRVFGVEITPMLAGLGIGGLAVALALKDTLANFFSAVYITADRPIKIGDYIEIDKKTAGYVHNIGWRSTRIKTWDGNYIVIPNSKIAESMLRNYNEPGEKLIFSVECGVSYGSNLEKVERVVVDVAKKVLKKEKGGVSDFQPLVRFKEFGDSSINFITLLQSKTRVDKFAVRSEFIKSLHKTFKKENIEIPFPQIDVHNRK